MLLNGIGELMFDMLSIGMNNSVPFLDENMVAAGMIQSKFPCAENTCTPKHVRVDIQFLLIVKILIHTTMHK